MKYGFIIDNTRCIGCHACTVACKSEHDVPIGVNRTWVKYIEKGNFPNTRRLFSVMRCNHCEDSPCTDICPTSALFTRTDGIVDFNNDRCIGCKACMQACPYDALYIDPNQHTAAKCNYCAHRVDVGLEPSCVNVCPTNAIISGDMDNPESIISQTLSRNQVTVRKGEKATKPKLFYIEGDESSLTPINSETSERSLWGDQKKGVGHHAEKHAGEFKGVVEKGIANKKKSSSIPSSTSYSSTEAKRVYDSPSKGVLWGWEVAGYIYTKAIAAGIFSIPLLLHMLEVVNFSNRTLYTLWGISFFFLGLTGILLIKDLDQPKRFLYVLLRPHFNSWLVKGAYIISGYGFFMTLWLVLKILEVDSKIINFIGIPLIGFAFLTSIYTAFLLAQAKGRDFWQNPLLVISMLSHTLIGSASIFILISLLLNFEFRSFDYILMAGLTLHLIIIGSEIYTPHPTTDSKVTFNIITRGKFKNQFIFGMILTGIILPISFFIILKAFGLTDQTADLTYLLIAVCALIGMWYSIKAWIYAPQMIQLS